MKTIEEWFNLIQDPQIRERALRNSVDASSDITASNMADAINCGFIWAGTPEGRQYWGDIHYQCSLDKNYLIKPKRKLFIYD